MRNRLMLTTGLKLNFSCKLNSLTEQSSGKPERWEPSGPDGKREAKQASALPLFHNQDDDEEEDDEDQDARADARYLHHPVRLLRGVGDHLWFFCCCC